MTVSDATSRFGALGAWFVRYLPVDDLVSAAREAEDLGYGTVWISGGVDPGVLDLVERVLASTQHVTVATGIVNLWAETPLSVTRAWHSYEERHPGRVYLGLGISHAPLVKESMNVDYRRPLAKTVAFLDELDAQTDPLPPERRLLGAHGPKMLEVAATRTLGTHQYHVATTNTAAARAAVGEGFVAPELGVVLDPDLQAARATGRSAIEYYLRLPNYTNSWLRAGFTDADLAHGGSDHLIDTVFALGDADAIGARVASHREAGADHVAIQVLGDDPDHGRVLRALANL